MSYEQTVKAALAETKSKFALAEALATEIPARRKGGNTEDETKIHGELTVVRQAIIDAGGEARSVKTLSNYRETALWVGSSPEVGGTFRWANASFSAHNEAREYGMRAQDFRRKPRNVDQLRKEFGKPGTDGPPTKVAESWSSTDKAEVAKELLADPEVAEQVEDDLIDHVASRPELASRVVEKDYEQRPKAGKAEPTDERPEEAFTKLAIAWRRIRRDVGDMLTLVQSGNIPRTEQVSEAIATEAAWLHNAADLLSSAGKSSSATFDDELAALLDGDA